MVRWSAWFTSRLSYLSQVTNLALNLEGTMFKKVLIANRGEIAVRVIRACQERGLTTVAVFSDADRAALHVRYADEAYRIGPPPARESYLNAAAIIAAAHRSGAEAIHPGYGFLSESEGFAQAVLDAGLAWVGPSPAAIRAMGDKMAARRSMMAAGVPVVPGSDGEGCDACAVLSDAEMARAAERIGYPVLVKASAGGGGKGMRDRQRAGRVATRPGRGAPRGAQAPLAATRSISRS